MTANDMIALMPLIILTVGSVLVLLAGAVRSGFYLYEVAAAAAAGALVWSLAVPATAIMPGLSITAFSRFFSAFLYGTGIISLLLAAGYNRRRDITGEEFPSTLLFALLGMGVACAANNLLMLFLGLESFTFAFYIMVAIEREAPRGGEAGLKYLLNGTLSAAILAMGIALIYCSRGTLRLAELAQSASSAESGTLFAAGAGLILLGLAFKLSLVPAHLWTADVYQGAPAPVTAMLSTASKAASVAALLLLLPLVPMGHLGHDIFWWLALLSMLFGNLAALVQTSLKRMLAWSSVAQMGYLAIGFVVAPSAGGIGASAFYAVAYAAAGLVTFGAVAVLSDRSERDRIEDYQGYGFKNPLAGAVLALALFSLAGIPPTAGFMGKFVIFVAALRGGETALAVVGVVTALVSVFFYLRVVVTLYMKPAQTSLSLERPLLISEVAALCIPAAVMLLAGVYPGPLLNLLAFTR
ncbi:NADH-quinone oxidoreductase subunit N [Geobacter sp. SVR]|uniref:NADH-quinone oxidoreductase subunit N n=1 Tax=Geobacter sp. SVR TaxID=2495594 RepID=UPI00143EFF85|nr:NADH-quinone oxidoreductase subunit N [Geobacter sp. SVR]BCS52318.1 NADH-quinone oxidoreductase subunit N [Geobacter sp. SVR]GCF85023.1 NADH-quinone oxidoreductase subunit N [Geobacter sp. SVR]